ncbi:MAG: transposase [Thermoleophilia bacterium]|nr:transposase [Thermoleophilia bacterium]
MARPLRIQFAGALYHLTSRGTGRRFVFLDDADRLLFLESLRQVVERFGWRLHAYCLMGNHFHLLVETPQPNLARGMRQVNGVYAQRFNRRHQRWGHLFGHRYQAILVHREGHLLELARYIVRNPVRAGLCRSPLDWRWSSCRATAGLEPVPSFLTVDWLLAQFGSDRARAQRAYRDFVEEAADERVLEAVFADLYLGERAHLRRRGGGRPNDSEITRAQRAPIRESLRRLLADESDAAVLRAYYEHGYTLRELASELGVHYATISRRLARAEAARARTGRIGGDRVLRCKT